MSASARIVSAKLFVVFRSGHLGPIKLTVKDNEKPEVLLSNPQLEEALGLPVDNRTPGPKHFFMPSGSSINQLDPTATWKRHRLAEDDHLILSDTTDPAGVLATYLTICDLKGVVPHLTPPRDGYTDGPINDTAGPTDPLTLDWLLRHLPIALWGTLLGAFVVAFSVGVSAGNTTFVRELLGRSDTAPTVTWAGIWTSSTSTTRSILIEFKQEESDIVGCYEYAHSAHGLVQGRITGKVFGRAIVGEWSEVLSGKKLLGLVHLVHLPRSDSFRGRLSGGRLGDKLSSWEGACDETGRRLTRACS